MRRLGFFLLLALCSGCAKKPTQKELADFSEPFCAFMRHEAPPGWEGGQSSGVLSDLWDLAPKYGKTCTWRAVEDRTPTADPSDQQSHVIYLSGTSKDFLEMHVRYEGPNKGFRLLLVKMLEMPEDDSPPTTEEADE